MPFQTSVGSGVAVTVFGLHSVSAIAFGTMFEVGWAAVVFVDPTENRMKCRTSLAYCSLRIWTLKIWTDIFKLFFFIDSDGQLHETWKKLEHSGSCDSYLTVENHCDQARRKRKLPMSFLTMLIWSSICLQTSGRQKLLEHVDGNQTRWKTLSDKQLIPTDIEDGRRVIYDEFCSMLLLLLLTDFSPRPRSGDTWFGHRFVPKFKGSSRKNRPRTLPGFVG